VGAPEELHERPQNRRVASFVGRANLLAGTLERTGEAWAVRIASGTAWPGELVEPLAAGARAELMLRPEALAFTTAGSDEALGGEVVERRYAGATSRFRVATAGGLELEVLAPSGAARAGETVAVVPRREGPRGRIWSAPPEGEP
jgi:ABC-type Fe3+/spermidine/putrescine transport system ATPase subunit